MMVNNKTVALIAQKYMVECKSTFDDLSKIIQKLILCRKELREYDKQFVSIEQQRKEQQRQQQQQQQPTSSLANGCYGCAYACVEHCLVLLRSLLTAAATVSVDICNRIKHELCKNGVIEELVNFNMKNSLSVHVAAMPLANSQQQSPTPPSQVQSCWSKDIVSLIYILIKDNYKCAKRFNRCILTHVDKYLVQCPLATTTIDLKHEMLLLATFIQKQDDLCWELRLKLIFQILIRAINATDATTTATVIDMVLTAPLMRIVNHVCKSSTANIINILTATTGMAKTKSLQKHDSALMRFFSEPGVNNHLLSGVFSNNDNDSQFVFEQGGGAAQPSDLINYFHSCCDHNVDISLNEFLMDSDGDDEVNDTYYNQWLRMHRFINNDNSLINSIGNYNNKNLVKKCFQLWSKSMRRSKQQQSPVPGWSSFSIYMICMSICHCSLLKAAKKCSTRIGSS